MAQEQSNPPSEENSLAMLVVLVVLIAIIVIALMYFFGLGSSIGGNSDIDVNAPDVEEVVPVSVPTPDTTPSTPT